MSDRRSQIRYCCLLVALLAACGGDESPSATAENLDALAANPYLSRASSASRDDGCGVVLHRRDSAVPGYNLFQDYDDRVYLMAMDGRLAHLWDLDGRGRIEFARLLPDGDLLVVGTNNLLRVGWDGEIEMQVRGPYHHDVTTLGDGSYLVLSEERRAYNGYDVRFDVVEHRDATGQLLGSWSTWEHFEELRPLHRGSLLDEPNQELRQGQFDYFHLNTIGVLPETPLGKKDRRFRRGNWLLCSRHTDLIFIVDGDSGEVVWGWGPGELEWPHYPVMRDDGSIVVFDNGVRRGYSRLVRLDPESGEVLWQWTAEPPKSFYSSIRGAAQPLAGGHFLVTASESARAFEIDDAGRVVWDYRHANLIDGERRSIYRMMRYPEALVEPLLRLPGTVRGAALDSSRCAEEPAEDRAVPRAAAALAAPEPLQPTPAPLAQPWDLSTAQLSASPLAQGTLASLVDGSPDEGVAFAGENPAQVTIELPGERRLAAVRIFAGRPGDPSDSNDWWLSCEVAEGGEVSWREVVPRRRDVVARWDGAELESAVRTRRCRLQVERTRRDDRVHLGEVELGGG